ncbi:uncharacterized protein LOC109538897 [Dendroctonus ponderosae]|uniref:C2H2-type domain-containing protein n=1 Tax=Dendroctonus ponderosae TaxID=77166 RepID=A0AAR5PLV2_DENPD|nr:uncharacterized protein LOC109538897 [Dendroctonus ponderosae]
MSETTVPVEEMEVVEENGESIKDSNESPGELSDGEEISADLPEIEIEPCRLCDDVTEKMFNIFEDNPEGYQLIGLIKENLPIVLYKTDPLSKLVCDKCVLNLQLISSLKKRSRKTQDKYVEKLKTEGDTTDKNILLFLGCTGSKLIENGDEDEEEEEDLKDQATSTHDLTILCANCKTGILDASTVNGEIELSTDLHEMLRESLKKNRVFTGEEASHYDDIDIPSDIESNESNENHPAKRRKIDKSSKEIQDEINQELAKRKTEDNGTDDSSEEKDKDSEHTFDDSDGELNEKSDEERKAEQDRIAQIKTTCVNIFKEEPEFTFEPLSLMELTVAYFNERNVPNYEAIYCKRIPSHPTCKICHIIFKNSKLLAVHETTHMEVDIDERIDQPKPWPNEHPFAKIRNKWLTNFDEVVYDADEEAETNQETVVRAEEDATLLVEDTGKTLDASKNDEVVLVGMKPMVNGIYLGDYTKEERKAFYQCMRIGGQTKRFCALCRYCFKDNWAIESHYFSFACFYTCRYCGMRFNKQRHRFDEHVQDHKKHEHSLSDKIYTASKLNNTLPKIIQPDKVKKIVPGEPEKPREIRLEDYSSPPVIMKGGFDQRNKQSNATQTSSPNLNSLVKVKEEPKDLVNPQSKTQNQAYFCRKCYKVFFKLDEFNAHSKNCDYNSYAPGFGPTMKPGMPGPSSKPNPQVKVKQEPGTEPKINGDMSTAGRPVRNCARDIGPYKDEVYIPKQILNETVPGPPQSFICHICGTPFPTIYSRNSHMRIHKGEPQGGAANGGPNPQMIMQQNILKQRLQQQQTFQMQKAALQQQQIQQKQMLRQKQIQQRVQQQQQQNYSQYEEIRVKEEPVDSFEPMVEIHEGHERSPSPPSLPREIGGGAVSLTPIIKKPALNPNILKLVENNPNISLVTKRASSSPVQRSHGGNIIKNAGGYQGPYAPANQPNSGPAANFITVAPNLMLNDDKSYKCSSCWEAFSNKSHLYFHKKNQCEGSRFPCPFCKKRFGTEAAYSSHIFYSHPE